MTINRYNYQEYFLLYTDNELLPEDMLAVENFVLSNPDLEEELTSLQQAVFVPDNKIIFENKALLHQFEKNESPVNADNFNELAISYLDDELSMDEKLSLEKFIRANPQYQKEFDLIQSLKLTPEESITFPDKQVLLRRETKKPVMLPWLRMAAAAVLILSIGAGLTRLSKNSSSNHSQQVAEKLNTKPSEPAEKTSSKMAGIKKDTNVDKNLEKKNGQPIDPKNNLAFTGAGNRQNTKRPNIKIKPAFKAPASTGENSNLANNDKIQNNTAENTTVVEPKASRVSNKSFEKSKTIGESMATIDASIEKNTKSFKNQPEVKINVTGNDEYSIAKNVANTEPDESELTSDKKNPLRGILRKASRFIDKNTAFRTSKKSGLLIGNVEIAFQ